MTLHPIIAAAGRGELPRWTRAKPRRRAHMERVAELLGAWAAALGLGAEEEVRWRALGYLHDVLRDAPGEELRPLVAPELRGLADQLLHGPAGAVRLREEGVEDPDFLRAVSYHTLGHPELDQLGRALYAADFLEPGRTFLPEWREELRARMPHELDQVVREVLVVRLERLKGTEGPIRPETLAFMEALAPGDTP